MLSDLSGRQLKNEYARLNKLRNACEVSLRDVRDEMKRRERERGKELKPTVSEAPVYEKGDVWSSVLDKKGDVVEWWGMSSDGVSGPWTNKAAAEAASRDMFKTALIHDKKGI